MTDQVAQGVVTIMHTDVEGSTHLTTRLGDELAQHRIHEMKRIVREQVSSHGGREIDNPGDGFMLTFSSTRRAIECAIAIQRALRDHDQEHAEDGVRVRIGLNVGEVVGDDEHPFGAAINAGARVMSQAKGGQIFVSETVRRLAGTMPGVSFRDRGRIRMKGLEERWRLYEIAWDERAPVAPRPKPATARPRARRLVLLLSALAAAVALAVALALFTRHSSGVASISPNAVGVIDPKTNKLIGEVHVGVRPQAVTVGDGSVWVANVDDQSLSRIDPKTRQVIRNPSAGGYPSDIAFGEGAVWVAHGPLATVTRVVPQVNRAARPIKALGGAMGCGPPAASVTVGPGAVWFACESGQLGRIDPQTNKAISLTGLATSPTGVLPDFSDIAFGLGALWIANRSTNTVTEVDPATDQRIQDITVGHAPAALAVDANNRAVWVADFQENAVTRISVPRGGFPATPPERISVGHGPIDVAVGDGAVWVVNANDGTVSRIDPMKNKVVKTIHVGNAPQRIGAGLGRVWITVAATS
jgi:YVTN family beta-propeller protein